jgi:hypothetical protein
MRRQSQPRDVGRRPCLAGGIAFLGSVFAEGLTVGTAASTKVASIETGASSTLPTGSATTAVWDKGTEEVTCRHCGTRHMADYREYLLSNIGSQGCLSAGMN